VGRACPFKIASDFSHVYRVLDDGALSLGWLQKEAEEEDVRRSRRKRCESGCCSCKAATLKELFLGKVGTTKKQVINSS
jgi:hypothetical protein